MPRWQERTAEVLDEVGLQGREQDRVAELSTGLKRRVGLARALLREPELLFLDEPTSSLDPQAQRDFRELIVSLSRDRRLTVFLNTHDLDEAQRICNRVAILDQGRVRLIGRTEDLRAGRPQVEVVFPSGEEARKAERVLVADGRVNGTVRMGATLICDLTAPVSIRDLLNMGLEVKEFKSRSRGLDEVYFEVLGQEAVA
ncbi:MAG TPA: ABC transporter ATP-binding protein [Euryarchaeota archaeon]|nr:ABC transporter ATP-binding protein [Euryarchaeota archaeon]